MSDVPVVEQKPVEVTDTPAALAAGEPAKTEEIPAVIDTPAAIEETPAANAQETPEDTKEEAKPVETETEKTQPQKGPGILAKLIAPFKTKGPKSPRRTTEKKKEAETPVAEEASKPEETPATTDAAEPAKEATEPVKETATPEAETSAETPAAVEATEKKEEKKSKSKFTRRLSYQIGDFFKKSKSEVPTTAKVNEHPPKIDEPAFVAPLENPASEGSSVPAETSAEPSELPKPVEPAAVTTPVVAAAAA